MIPMNSSTSWLLKTEVGYYLTMRHAVALPSIVPLYWNSGRPDVLTEGLPLWVHNQPRCVHSRSFYRSLEAPHNSCITICQDMRRQNLNICIKKGIRFPYNLCCELKWNVHKLCIALWGNIAPTEWSLFTNLAPLGRVGHRVAMSVCLSHRVQFFF